MAEYVRFVSYLYGYQQNVRNSNVGFVKYEVRNGLKRLLVQVNGIRRVNNRLQIYAFYRDYDSCIGIKLGTLVLKNGRGNFQYSTYADAIGNLDESECKFEEISGMVVTGDTAGDAIYCSVWDNKPFSTDMFVKSRQELMTFRAAELEEDGPSDTQVSENDGAPVTGESAERKLENEEEKEEPDRGNEKTDNVSTDIPVNPEIPEIPTSPQSPEEPMSPVGTVQNLKVQQFGLRRQTIWDRLCKMYPKAAPFPYDIRVRCLRMRPNDLGRLPRENWTLANNSFLLHGFFQYRYILLIKIPGETEEYEERFMLAVPGVYTGLDRHLAEMFGFPEFKSSPRENISEGQFGYWMKEIVME